MKKHFIIVVIIAFTLSNCSLRDEVKLSFKQNNNLKENTELYFNAVFTKKGMTFYQNIEEEAIVKQIRKAIVNEIIANKDILNTLPIILI